MLTSNHIARLWVTMTRIYGHRWTSSFGKADNGVWLAGLERLSSEQLIFGFDVCIHRADSWPPTLPEFRALCLGTPDTEAIVQKALAGDPDEHAERLRRSVKSWDRDHGTRHDLARLYRANVDDLVAQIQAERAGKPLDYAQEVEQFAKHLTGES